jgi:phenylacetate-CoA ligase
MRVLLMIHNAYTDASSGAARSERTLCEWLVEAGHECQVLSTARFDANAPADFEEHLQELGVEVRWENPANQRPVGHYTLRGVPVTVLWTQHHGFEDVNAGEIGQYLELLDQRLTTFRPDVVQTYGGHQLVREALVRIKRRGGVINTTLHSYGYHHRHWFEPIDQVIVPSRYLADYYFVAIGLKTTVLPSPMRWAEVEAASNTREYVTLINPSAHKGAALFARIVTELSDKRPDIPFLVIESSPMGEALRQFPEADLCKLKHIVAGPPTQDAREFYGLTKLLLVPSVFAEPSARVSIEAMINGIPPLVSDRGGIAQSVQGAGRVLPVPNWMTPATRRLPSAAEVEPWCEAICELWDDASKYADASRLARRTAERCFSEAELRRRYVEHFASLRPKAQPLVSAAPVHPSVLNTPFQVRASPGDRWPAIPEVPAAQPWALYQELERTQWLPPEEIERRQLVQARFLIAHCLAQVPYYRTTLGAAGIRLEDIKTLADLRRLPILPRRTYRERMHEVRASRLPAGVIARSNAVTSGTMGIPIEVSQSNVTNTWWLACYLRDLAWCGIDPRGRLAVIKYFPAKGSELEQLLRGATAPAWERNVHQVIATGPAHCLDVRVEPRRQLDWLLEVDPDYLLIKPSALELLAILAQQHGVHLPRLRGIQSYDETLTPQIKERAAAAFGAPVFNLYSCSEAGYVASCCPDGHGMHFHAENVLAEVLDEHGQPCRPGQTGRIVLTTLHNFVTPLLRYEIQDEATVGVNPCPCGRGLPLLAQVEGKERPIFVLPDGRLRHSSPLIVDLRKHPGFVQYQVVQETRNQLVIRLVPEATWTDVTRAGMVKTVREFFEAPVNVEIELVDRLPFSKGGKVRTVICEAT